MMLGGNMGPTFQLYRLPRSTLHLLFSAFELRILVGDANNTWESISMCNSQHLSTWSGLTAGGTGTGVASLEGLLVATLAEVIGAGVDNNSALDAC